MRRGVAIFAINLLLVFVPAGFASTTALSQAKAAAHPACPVVLVHGFADNSSRMQTMAAYLRTQGRTVYTPTLGPSCGQVGIDGLASQLSAFIHARIKPGEKFDLVGFSMGGLICRYYLQKVDGGHCVAHLVTLAAPNHGSMLAWMLPNSGGRQMRPGSELLNDLNNDTAVYQKVKFTSISSPFDLAIIPNGSSEIPQAHGERLPVVMHWLMASDKRCLRAVVVALED